MQDTDHNSHGLFPLDYSVAKKANVSKRQTQKYNLEVRNR